MPQDDPSPSESSAGPPPKGRDHEGPPPFGLFPLVVLLVVVATGLFLVFELRDISKVQDCVWSGRKNCVVVDPGR